MKESAAPAVPGLIPLLKDPEKRSHVIHALFQIGNPAEPALLAELVRVPSMEKALWEIGVMENGLVLPRFEGIRRYLVRNGMDPLIRLDAIWSLPPESRESETVVSLVKELLQSQDRYQVRRTLHRLALNPDRARVCADLIRPFVNDRNFRSSAWAALLSIDFEKYGQELAFQKQDLPPAIWNKLLNYLMHHSPLSHNPVRIRLLCSDLGDHEMQLSISRDFAAMLQRGVIDEPWRSRAMDWLEKHSHQHNAVAPLEQRKSLEVRGSGLEFP